MTRGDLLHWGQHARHGLTADGAKGLMVTKVWKGDHMWICSKCGETSDDDFDVCWKCQTGRDGSPPEDLPLDSGSEERPWHEPAAEEQLRRAEERTTGGRRSVRPAHRDSQGSDYEYLVVPFIGEIKQGFFSSQNAQDVSHQLQSVISSHAKEGWQFYSLEKVDIQVSVGCLASLFGAKAGLITFDQIIFRRPMA
jgi:hypothetical protein